MRVLRYVTGIQYVCRSVRCDDVGYEQARLAESDTALQNAQVSASLEVEFESATIQV